MSSLGPFPFVIPYIPICRPYIPLWNPEPFGFAQDRLREGSVFVP
jgi:hypothetical protein